MAHNVEEVKKASQFLRGTLKQTLDNPESTHFDDDGKTLCKFHGMYQEEDRDQRMARIKAKQDPAYILMIRCRIPGGNVTAAQYLELDKLADDCANSTIRITTRQGIQYHGVPMKSARELVQRINRAELTTWNTCGDVNRNTMACPAPLDTHVHREVQRFAQEIAANLAARPNGYFDVWFNGEKMKLDGKEPGEETGPDPLYGEVYLPRKFKTGIAVPPSNDIDVYSQDLGFVPHFPNHIVEGYTVLVGGGFGMDHAKEATYPALAEPLFYVKKEYAIEAAKAVLKAQRDHGDRGNRKHARLKYIIQEKGVAWFREKVLAHFPHPYEPAKPFFFDSLSDPLGWHEQGDGKFFYGFRVENGRVADFDQKRIRSALRAIAQRFGTRMRLTANQNILILDLKSEDRTAFESILYAHGIPGPETMTQARRFSMACVALPTCALALSESERNFPKVMDGIDAVLRELGLAESPILFRMTGCPNGCARPYNADFGFVGRGAGKYTMYVGGSYVGDRLAGMHTKTVADTEIPAKVKEILVDYVKNKRESETFTAYWGRTQNQGPRPHPSQFHVELAERKKRLEAAKVAQGPVG